MVLELDGGAKSGMLGMTMCRSYKCCMHMEVLNLSSALGSNKLRAPMEMEKEKEFLLNACKDPFGNIGVDDADVVFDNFDTDIL
eukprot:10944994-Ditylum_brightwellii.AAC.1